MYEPSFKLISHNMFKKRLENFSLARSSSNTPFASVFGRKVDQSVPIGMKLELNM